MFTLKVAFRFLKDKIFQFITVIGIVTLGTSILYFMFISTKELNQFVLDTVLKDFSDILYVGPIENNPEQFSTFKAELMETHDMIEDVSFFNLVDVTNNRYSYYLKGVNFDEVTKINDLTMLVQSLDVNRIPTDGPFIGYDLEIMVGGTFAQRNNYRGKGYADFVGKVVPVIINDQTYRAKVVGVYMAGNVNLNTHMAFTTSDTIIRLTSNPYLNGIEVNLTEPLKNRKVLEEIAPFVETYYPNLHGSVWQEQNRIIDDLLVLEDTSILIIQFFIAVAVAFSVATIIFINTRTRLTQIGILKALGLNQKQVRRVFLIHIVLYLTIGVVLGIYLGNTYGYFFHKIVTDEHGKPLLTLPLYFWHLQSLWTALIIGGGVLLASLYPIVLTGRLRVIKIIKADR